jgi:hypothetical protein
MIVVRNKIADFLIAGNFSALCIWPFLFVRPGIQVTELSVTLNHERIHARQQLEMLWVFFFLWYSIEYLIRLRKHHNGNKAYHAISHEKEAFSNEANLQYLKKRKAYAWIKYL